ncbi:hypothetical protein [Zavarzinella formosa]|uniref:hypothetical protein n=1 Tax=Zavarzinella formosa TaxID=360055 RepID=UPI00030E64E9|nr:hypothetical protein [Zavarzinella formosa]
MIERPKRSVTRFFVPLLDVMILLFGMFMLMPFVSKDPDAQEPVVEKKDNSPAPLPTDVVEIRQALEKARREIERLKALGRSSLSDRMSVKVLEIDPKDGRLYYIQDGKPVQVDSELAAENMITIHKRQAGNREPFFLILYPRKRSGFPEQQQADDYARWFRGVQFQFDRPFATAP